MAPRVSVITPSFNQGHFIEQTIQSVINQNYPNLEYIIIDGGSTDNTIEIIKKYEQHLAYWISEKDSGQSHAFNKGLAKATGDFVGWLNSDDLYYPNSIKSAVSVLLQNPSVDVVFGNYDSIDTNGKLIHTRKEINFDYEIYLWTKGCYHANLAGLFKRSCFQNYGGLREDLHYVMDYEIYLRLGYNNCKFVQMQKIMGAYRFHMTSKTVTVSNNSVTLELDKVFEEYSSKTTTSAFSKVVNPFYYRLARYFKKMLNGSYSVSSFFTRRRLKDMVA